MNWGGDWQRRMYVDRMGKSLRWREKERGELSIWVSPHAQHSNRPQREEERAMRRRSERI